MPKKTTDYPSPKPFLKIARHHQRSWLRKHLGLESTDEERVLLPPKAAYAGQNFFNAAVGALVKKRFPKTFEPNKANGPRRLASDALRSEHIPFNLFGPLDKHRESDDLIAFFSALTGVQLTAIEKIIFEEPDHEKLHDNTAFDAYVTARQGTATYAIGIEVKYTEGSYAWGKTEKERMKEPTDIYNRYTREAKEFRDGAAENLCNRHLKQIWRNFLLGIVSRESPTDNFIYVHLYPKGNCHQAVVCKKFSEQLTPAGLAIFRPTTYEDFLKIAEKHLNCILAEWIQYIEDRYIV